MDSSQNIIEVNIKYERVIKTYGGGGAQTEYFPTMEDGSMIVVKRSVGGIAVLEANHGVIDAYGREKVPCIYDSCEPINSKLFIVGKNYTEGYLDGDDYSFPKQKYGIVDSNGNVLVPLEMKGIYYKDNYVSIRGFNNEYYIGLINQNHKLTINEGLSYTVNDSLEDVYNALKGTNKIAAIGCGFILKDGDYSSFQEFIKAYYKFVNETNNSQFKEISIANESSIKKR